MTKKAGENWPRVVLIASFVPTCWLLMIVVHECGHVAAGLLTGGSVERVVLHPLAISRTDFSVNPRPLFTCWAGPLVGAIFPVAVTIVWRIGRFRGWHLVQFFAGFCLIANGAYIGVGSFDHVGDAGDLQQHGSPIWNLWLFGLVTVPSGLWLWHGLGRHFGLSGKPVSSRAAVGSVLVLVVVVILEVTFSNRI
ncbi:MAG: M50 family metallopeptidase [Planctomycetales bacterium]|nr:M50 family metallopeptidase [Planctomycetales bacterium]